MSETGPGPVSLDTPAEEPPADQTLAGRAAEPPMTIAYREYVTHLQDCSQCLRSVFRCATGNDLWDAYINTR